MFTKSTYAMTADVVGASTVMANLTTTQAEDLAVEFAKRFAADNERFDPRRFFRATGLAPDEQKLDELMQLMSSR